MKVLNLELNDSTRSGLTKFKVMLFVSSDGSVLVVEGSHHEGKYYISQEFIPGEEDPVNNLTEKVFPLDCCEDEESKQNRDTFINKVTAFINKHIGE